MSTATAALSGGAASGAPLLVTNASFGSAASSLQPSGPAAMAPAAASPAAGTGSVGLLTATAAATARNPAADADALEAQLAEIFAVKEQKALEREREAAERAAAAAAAAADQPPVEEEEEEDGMCLFSFMPVVASSHGFEAAEEKVTEPKSFVDRHGVEWRLSQRMLGSGAFGNVFLGMGIEGQMVAIKAIKISEKSKDECRSVVKEIRLLGRLRSDQIVQYISSAVVDSFLMIVMEAVGGGSLLGVIQQYPTLPKKLVLSYIRDVLLGLRFLHSNGVVHRDIKPHNVLMNERGRCKLADFGTACHVAYASANEKAGDITGTILYMAPEACDAVLHVRSDVWSAGIMCFQMATKTLPYHPADIALPFAILSKLGKRNPEVFSPETAAAPPWIKSFIDACLTFDPDVRPSADDLLRHPALTSSPTAMTTVAADTADPPPINAGDRSNSAAKGRSA